MLLRQPAKEEVRQTNYLDVRPFSDPPLGSTWRRLLLIKMLFNELALEDVLIEDLAYGYVDTRKTETCLKLQEFCRFWAHGLVVHGLVFLGRRPGMSQGRVQSSKQQ